MVPFYRGYSLPLAALTILILLFFSDTSSSSAQESAMALSLTPQEQQWLTVHDNSIRIAHAPDWPPMDFLDDKGNPTGMVADYIRLIEKKLGIKFTIRPVGSWNEVLDLARKGEIDIISAGQETEERKEYMHWSTSYLTLNTTIIVEKRRKDSLTLEQMAGMTIGVPKGYAVGEFIRENYPYLSLVDVINSRDGIHKVSFGEIDAMVTEVPNALYLIEKENISNLRLAGVTGFLLNHSIGIRKDWDIFAQIIEKVLANITPEEHQEIRTRWIRLETTRTYLTPMFWYTVLGIFFFTLLVIGFILLWNRTLKIQVQQRTEELRNNEIGLEAVLELNERTYGSIEEIIEFAFRQMIRLTKSSFGYLAFDDQEGMLYIVNSSGAPESAYSTKRLTDGLDRETIGFWGEAVRRRRPVISNDYRESNPEQRGVPARYSNIIRYMNVPIFNRNKVMLVAGMGNKRTNYTTSDLRQLNLLAQGMWRLIQRKKAEQAILKGEKRFQDLVDNSPNGIAIIQDGNIVYRNSRQTELTGNLELFESSSYKFIHQDDLEKIERFYATIHSSTPAHTELDFRFYATPDQDDQASMKWVNCIATPIEFQDRNAVLLITIDMTEAKELERLLIVQDKMASLGHVSAGIAHEIRNPLSGININLRTIEKNYINPEKKEKVDRSIDAIRTASRKIESVIRRVMNFAKPTEAKFNLVDINVPLKEATDLARVTMKKNGISLLSELDDQLPQCYAEPHLIEEVILNLLNNAAEAIGESQEDKTIHLLSKAEGEQILIFVEDNGPGVPRDLREKIFEPFFTSKEHSTGIGLSLCHRIITDHKGTLKVAASGLGGAKFVISLPVTTNSTTSSSDRS